MEIVGDNLTALSPDNDEAKHLIVLDVDSTMTTTEGIDLLAEIAGVGPQVAAITASAMHGELDFEASLRQRVALLAGLKVSALVVAAARTRPSPGIDEMVAGLRQRGWRIGLVSGGFAPMVGQMAFSLALDHYRANTLEIVDGIITGQLVGPVIDRAAKAAALREWALADGIDLAATVAVGDGANDLDMLAAAGLGIAYHAKPAVVAAADAAITTGGLEQVLNLIDQHFGTD